MDMSCVGCMIAPLPTFSRLFAIKQRLVLAGIGTKVLTRSPQQNDIEQSVICTLINAFQDDNV